MRLHFIRVRRELHIRGARSFLWIVFVAATAACVAPADGGESPEPDPRDGAFADPAYRAAAEAMAARRPWRAESLLAPALQDSVRRTPWVVILAAEAAAATGDWKKVDSLLGHAPLQDAHAEAAAQLILARGALERGEASVALDHAHQARTIAPNSRAHGEALVFMARAYERLGQRDSARIAYEGAAGVLPLVGDWLTLRATSLMRDEDDRHKAYRRLRTDIGRRRANYAEAQLLERSGRPREAIPLYEQAGSPMAAMRLRAAVARGTEERDRARRELMAFIERRLGTPEARQAIEILDANRYQLTAAEEIIVAKSASRHGPLSRARTAMARAAKIRPLSGEERLFQLEILAETGPASRRSAERLLASFPTQSPYAGEAALLRAKLIRRRGAREAARAALRDVVKRYENDEIAAPGALMVLAEMAIDDKRDAAARDAYLAIARGYPSSDVAPNARYNAAILAYTMGRLKVAAAELDTLVMMYPTSSDASAAMYWSARAHAALQDSAAARERWEEVMARDPTSFYASLAARRLGVEPWAPPASPDTFASIPDVDEALARADQLERLGMDYEARVELDALYESATSNGERVLAIANAFRSRGQMRKAMELGRRAIALGSADARAYRMVYPIGEADLVVAEASGRKVDPALVAAVIRHESSFEPWATSPVGARGLMQVMPAVGKALARSERITPWDPKMLYEPEVNVRLGVLHLKTFTRQYSHETLALAAYNAGPGRVARWRQRPGARDPELFVERIRFTETRGYVRAVLRSRDFYQALYDWDQLGETAD